METNQPEQSTQAQKDGQADMIRSVEKRGYVHTGCKEGSPTYINMETEKPDPCPWKGGD